MTVKQLIAKLEKMPKNLTVYWADHDHGEYETNSSANCVRLIDKSDMDEWEKDLHENDERYACFNDTPEQYVVIRP